MVLLCSKAELCPRCRLYPSFPCLFSEDEETEISGDTGLETGTLDDNVVFICRFSNEVRSREDGEEATRGMKLPVERAGDSV